MSSNTPNRVPSSHTRRGQILIPPTLETLNKLQIGCVEGWTDRSMRNKIGARTPSVCGLGIPSMFSEPHLGDRLIVPFGLMLSEKILYTDFWGNVTPDCSAENQGTNCRGTSVICDQLLKWLNLVKVVAVAKDNISSLWVLAQAQFYSSISFGSQVGNVSAPGNGVARTI